MNDLGSPDGQKLPASKAGHEDPDDLVPPGGGEPVYKTDDRPPVTSEPSADGGATQTLSWLQRRTPFMDLFTSAAVSTRTEEKALERIAAMRKEHAGVYWLCWGADFLTRLVITALLILVIVGVAWKTLTPLPDWMDASN